MAVIASLKITLFIEKIMTGTTSFDYKMIFHLNFYCLKVRNKMFKFLFQTVILKFKFLISLCSYFHDSLMKTFRYTILMGTNTD